MRVLIRYSNNKVGKSGKRIEYGQTYDRIQKKYVSYSDILNLLKSDEPFVVRESKTGIDVTETTVVNAIFYEYRDSKAVNQAIIKAWVEEEKSA